MKKIDISWEKPTYTEHRKCEESFTKGEYNGILVAQNRFIRNHQKPEMNDFAFRVYGLTGWIASYEDFEKVIIKEDRKREKRRQQLRARGLLK